MKKIVLSLTMAAALFAGGMTAAPKAAEARTNIAIGVGGLFGGGYYAPYYAPAVYAPPVYGYPAYYYARPVYYGYGRPYPVGYRPGVRYYYVR